MTRTPSGAIRHGLSAALRGALAFAFILKSLVPLGYMPAALAEGGPFRLCDSAMPTITSHEHTGEPARDRIAHGNTETGPHAHHAGHGHTHEHAAATISGQQTGHDQGPHAGHDDHGPGDHAASQHAWERCALGGLASLAGIAFDWQWTLPTLDHVRTDLSDRPAYMRSATVPFQPRAPPPTHA